MKSYRRLSLISLEQTRARPGERERERSGGGAEARAITLKARSIDL